MCSGWAKSRSNNTINTSGKQPMDKPKRPRRAPASNPAGIFPDIPVGITESSAWTYSYFRGLIRGALRRIYFRWPGRIAALARVRVEVPAVTAKGIPKKRPEVWYKCEMCSALGKAQVSKKNPKGYLRVWVDHDPPLVPLDRPYLPWSEYVERLFCTADKLRILCDNCHYTVTQEQNAQRREYRRAARRQETGETESTSTNSTDSGSTE